MSSVPPTNRAYGAINFGADSQDLNREPTDYKTVALPIGAKSALYFIKYFVRSFRFELKSPVSRTAMLPDCTMT